MLDEPTRREIREAGRDPDAAARQLAVLRGAKPFTVLVRPATVGDGVRQLDDLDAQRLEQLADEAALAGRVGAFVPASGAASRMFRDTVRAWQAGHTTLDADSLDPKVREILIHLPDLAIWNGLVKAGASEHDVPSMLAALHGPEGLAVHDLAKGLVPFHPYPEGARTPFEEHLVETARLAKDAHGLVALHVTVGGQHRSAFETVLERSRKSFEKSLGAHFRVSFSEQDAETDTVAVDPDGALFRTSDGAVLFRPGGHGSLLRNLAAVGGDIVVVKNIDNVVPDDLRTPNLPWRKRLVGLLVQLQGTAHGLIRKLRRGAAVDDARAFLTRELGVTEPPSDPEALIARLDRPWRVCAMVRNDGQAGGGPFWAQSPDGVTLQIVESAQVADTPEQQAILGTSTHFNPVDMALGMRDVDGRTFDLDQYTDPDAVITAEKSSEGRALRAIEHPGLWNGGMAGWNTVFVEVPAHTFQPVKTMHDLLACTHGGPLC